MNAILKEDPAPVDRRRAAAAAGPRAHRPALPREEPGGALPVGARPRLRARGALRRRRATRRSTRVAPANAGAGCGPRLVAALAAAVGAALFVAGPLDGRRRRPDVRAAHVPARLRQLRALRARRADHRLRAPTGRAARSSSTRRSRAAPSRARSASRPTSRRVSSQRRDGRPAAARRARTPALARVPIGGGAPREVLENVQSADWGPTASRWRSCAPAGGATRSSSRSARCSTRPRHG